MVLSAGLLGLTGCPKAVPQVAPDTEVAAKGDTSKSDAGTQKKTGKTGPTDKGKGTDKGDGKGGQPAPVKWTLHETVLLTPEQARAAEPVSCHLAPDARRWAYVAKKYGGHTVILDGNDEPFTGQEISSFQFSPDSKQVAYVVRIGETYADREAPAVHVIWNGKEVLGETILAIGDGVLVSASAGQDLGTEREQPAKVFVHGTKAGTLKAEQPNVSDPAKLCAFSTVGGRLRWATPYLLGVLVDGEKVSKAQPKNISALQFSADGSTYAFVLTEGEGDDRQMVVVVNGEHHKPYAEVRGLTLSANGKVAGYLATGAGGKTFAAITGKEPIEAPKNATLVLSPDGSRWAILSDRRNAAVVVDGKADTLVNNASQLTAVLWPSPPGEGPPGLGAPFFAFSPDGKHYAYAVRELERDGDKVTCRVMRDGKPQQAWAEVSPSIAWAPDSGSLVYLARETPDGPWTVVRDETALPGGQALATEAEGKVVAVRFSPNGRHVAYAFRHGSAWQVVLDSQEVASYSRVFVDGGGFGFTADGRLVFLAQTDKGAVCHVELTPNDAKPAGPNKVGPPTVKDGWLALFNGTDLRRWEPVALEAKGSAWLVNRDGKLTGKDGVIESADKAVAGGLRTAGGGFKDFHLRLECRADQGRGAVAFRGGTVLVCNDDAAAARTGSFSHGVSLVKPDVEVKDKLAAEKEWFTLELLVQGKRVQVRVNGKVAAEVQMNDTAAGAGPIILYQDSQGQMGWRNVQVRESVDPAEWDRGKK
jgi:hypothetical protein